MFLFNRTVTLQGNPREVTSFVQDITSLVDERAPFGVSAWQVVLGAPVGTYSWSALVDSRAVLYASMAELSQDNDYLELLDRGADLIAAPGQDQLANIMHTGGGERARAAMGSVASITIAQIEVGRAPDAIEWSIGMADLVSGIIEEPVSFCTAEHGAFGEVGWLSTAADIAEVDRANEALNKDPEYMARLTKAGELFIPGSGRQLLSLRVA